MITIFSGSEDQNIVLSTIPVFPCIMYTHDWAATRINQVDYKIFCKIVCICALEVYTVLCIILYYIII